MHQGVQRIETRVSERTRKYVSISTRAGQRSPGHLDTFFKIDYTFSLPLRGKDAQTGGQYPLRQPGHIRFQSR